MNVPKTEVYKTIRRDIFFGHTGPTAEWRYRVKGGNGEVLCQSEGYTTKADAERGLRALRRALLPGTRDEGYTEAQATTMAWIAWKEGAQWAVDLGYTPSADEIRDGNPYG